MSHPVGPSDCRRDQAASPGARLCAHPECLAVGIHRAPRSPCRRDDYLWFCLDHVRAYNRMWNYCAGMAEPDIERLIRSAACWDRPTWPLGQWYLRRLREAADRLDESGLFGGGADARSPGRAPPDTADARALRILGLVRPVTWAAVRKRYKELAKRLHPDANGGDKSAEERLKLVNQAYSTLRNRAWP